METWHQDLRKLTVLTSAPPLSKSNDINDESDRKVLLRLYVAMYRPQWFFYHMCLFLGLEVIL